MFKKTIVGLFGALLFAGGAEAACSWTTLTNGTTADANQVMNDLNCLAPLASPSFTGNVGIGTTSPEALLDVYGTSAAIHIGQDSVPGTDGLNKIISNRGTNLTVQADNNLVLAADPDSLHSAPYRNIIFNTARYERMRIDGNGNVGIGTTSPAYTLQVNGSVAGSSAYTNLSDKRLKKDIHPIRNALKIIEQIHGVSFRWRTPAERRVGKKFDLPVDKPQIGFIAQNLEKVLPQAVSVGKGKDAIMTVAESKIVPVLVEAVKQLKAANDKLAAANAEAARQLKAANDRQAVTIKQLKVANDSQVAEIHAMQVQIRALQHKTRANAVKG